MKINIDDISEHGLSVDISEEGRDIEALAGGKLEFSFITPVAAHLDFVRTDGNIHVTGEIKGKIRLNCSRCLKEFDHELNINFTDFFVRGKEEGGEKELKDADLDVSYLEGPELDSTAMLLGQISLEVPIKPLCREDCKGLCSKCGADLNSGECGCDKDEKTDTRFAKLKDLKINKP
ncbi:MAG: DUF177 domain-containing protein [Deltaproteobacteria bacterium]|nr:DUF177 domain-containing protein [Deltaproteobacteria bacterium]